MKNIKKLFIGITVIFLFIAHPSFAQKENDINRKFAETWISNLNSHDTVAIANMYADDAYIESPNWEEVKRGPSAIREIYKRYFISSPDLKFTIINIITNDTAIVIEYYSSGTMQNLEGNAPEYMRGKKYTLKNCARMNMKNGKITEQRYYFDQVSFLKQVGFFDQK